MNPAFKRVLVTGGAGFIGANLVRTLLHCPGIGALRVVDDLSTGSLANLAGLDVDIRESSILDAEALAVAAADCDAIVHLAAIPSVPRSIADPLRTHHVNTTGTLNVLEVARVSGASVIVASSSSVYGSNPALPKTEDLRCEPMSPYAVSKLATECYSLAYARCYGVPVLAFRFFNVFGPLQASGHAYAAVVPAFIEAALTQRPLIVHGDGRQTRDFTYVGTVTAVLASALLHDIRCADVLNLAFGTHTSLLELICLLQKLLGRELVRQHVPEREGDVRASQADSTRLRGVFPDVEPVPLRDALKLTVEWFERERGPA